MFSISNPEEAGVSLRPRLTKTMTKEELLEKLRELDGTDPEGEHVVADELLLEYINDKEIHDEYQSLVRWYS